MNVSRTVGYSEKSPKERWMCGYECFRDIWANKPLVLKNIKQVKLTRFSWSCECTLGNHEWGKTPNATTHQASRSEVLVDRLPLGKKITLGQPQKIIMEILVGLIGNPLLLTNTFIFIQKQLWLTLMSASYPSSVSSVDKECTKWLWRFRGFWEAFLFVLICFVLVV